MGKHLRHPATIIASLALFVAFGGGAAWAGGLISGSPCLLERASSSSPSPTRQSPPRSRCCAFSARPSAT